MAFTLLARPGDQGTGRRGLLSRLARFQDDRVEPSCMGSSDGLIVKSRLILDELVRWYGIGQEKIRIIPNGVDFAHYANASVPSPVMDEIGGRLAHRRSHSLAGSQP
ncbi:MAG: glycosyltransferase [Burkholderiales bacterium]